MQKEARSIDISHIPELLRLAEEVKASKRPAVLTREGEELAVVQPAPDAPPKRRKAGVITTNDPLSQLVGTLASEEPTDASKKHEYLAHSRPST